MLAKTPASCVMNPSQKAIDVIEDRFACYRITSQKGQLTVVAIGVMESTGVLLGRRSFLWRCLGWLLDFGCQFQSSQRGCRVAIFECSRGAEAC